MVMARRSVVAVASAVLATTCLARAAGAAVAIEEECGLSLLQVRADVVSGLQQPAGINVQLSEDGYQLIANLNSDPDMKAFMLKVIETEGRWIIPAKENQLDALVPYYSGNQSVRSYQALVKEVQSARWMSKEVDSVYWGKAARLGTSGKFTCYVDRERSTGTTMDVAKQICDEDFECTFLWSKDCQADAWIPCFVDVSEFIAEPLEDVSSCTLPKLTYEEMQNEPAV